MRIQQALLLLLSLLMPSAIHAQEGNASIRAVDFANFTYPWPADLSDGSRPRQAFTLKNGQLPAVRDDKGFIISEGIFLLGIDYGDVTGDGIEEAVLSMSILTGGSAMPGMVYIYARQGKRTTLLWSFSTGDRADGGLRAVYAECGQLVIELNSPVDSNGDCCPTRFTRRRYGWQERHFQLLEDETLPIPF